MLDHLTLMPAIKVALAGSGLWSDGFVQADRVIDALGPGGYGDQVVAMTTNLKVDPADSPPRTYKKADANADDFILRAIGWGNFVGFQTGGLSAIASGQFYVEACEDAIASYGAHFIESQSNRFNDNTIYSLPAVGGWPGGSARMREYLTTHASNLQDRLPGA